MPRRDGDPTIREVARLDGPVITEGLLEMAHSRGYYGEAAVKYALDVVQSVLDELKKPEWLLASYVVGRSDNA